MDHRQKMKLVRLVLWRNNYYLFISDLNFEYFNMHSRRRACRRDVLKFKCSSQGRSGVSHDRFKSRR